MLGLKSIGIMYKLYSIAFKLLYIAGMYALDGCPVCRTYVRNGILQVDTKKDTASSWRCVSCTTAASFGPGNVYLCVFKIKYYSNVARFLNIRWTVYFIFAVPKIPDRVVTWINTCIRIKKKNL